MGNQRKLLLWDFEGTLAYRNGGWAGALASVAQETEPQRAAAAADFRPFLQYGFPWHAPENAHPGLSPDEWWEDLLPLFARAFRSAGFSNAALMARRVREVYLQVDQWHCFEDVQPVLDMLKQRGWTHVLLTNHVPELPHLLKALNLTGSFTNIFNSAETGYEKPNPKAFRAVLEWAGPLQAAWVIGDSYSADYMGAQENNLSAILVRNTHPAVQPAAPSLDQIVDLL